MLEYSIGELKYYYSSDSNYGGDFSRDDIESINFLEDTLSDTIDSDHINNSVYHIFPSIVAIAAAAAAAAAITVASTAILTFT
jgi:hypothetical protein